MFSLSMYGVAFRVFSFAGYARWDDLVFFFIVLLPVGLIAFISYITVISFDKSQPRGGLLALVPFTVGCLPFLLIPPEVEPELITLASVVLVFAAYLLTAIRLVNNYMRGQGDKVSSMKVGRYAITLMVYHLNKLMIVLCFLAAVTYHQFILSGAVNFPDSSIPAFSIFIFGSLFICGASSIIELARAQ